MGEPRSSATRRVEQVRSARMVICRILKLDGTYFETSVDKRAFGKTLFEIVCDNLDLLEKDYFGLSYREPSMGVKVWLNNDKKISKQMKGIPWEYAFEVKFYPGDPQQLHEDLTRYQLCLQLRNDIVSGKLPCSVVTYTLLGSYTVQSELGDFEVEEHGPGIEYLKEMQFAPNQDRELLKKIAELHKTHKGQTPEESELHFLENAKKLALYGVQLHDAKDAFGVDIQIGVCASGIIIFQDKLQINKFVWPKVIKMSYRRSKFYVKLRAGEFEDFQSQIGFRLLNVKLAKIIWKICVEHHSFFRFREADTPKKHGLFPRFGSQFRYSGRTMFQTRTAMSFSDRPSPYFDRVHSKRATYHGRTQNKSVHDEYYKPRPPREKEPPPIAPRYRDEEDHEDRQPSEEPEYSDREREGDESEEDSPADRKSRMEKIHAVPTPLAVVMHPEEKLIENNVEGPPHYNHHDEDEDSLPDKHPEDEVMVRKQNSYPECFSNFNSGKRVLHGLNFTATNPVKKLNVSFADKPHVQKDCRKIIGRRKMAKKTVSFDENSLQGSRSDVSISGSNFQSPFIETYGEEPRSYIKRSTKNSSKKEGDSRRQESGYFKNNTQSSSKQESKSSDADKQEQTRYIKRSSKTSPSYDGRSSRRNWNSSKQYLKDTYTVKQGVRSDSTSQDEESIESNTEENVKPLWLSDSQFKPNDVVHALKHEREKNSKQQNTDLKLNHKVVDKSHFSNKMNKKDSVLYKYSSVGDIDSKFEINTNSDFPNRVSYSSMQDILTPSVDDRNRLEMCSVASAGSSIDSLSLLDHSSNRIYTYSSSDGSDIGDSLDFEEKFKFLGNRNQTDVVGEKGSRDFEQKKFVSSEHSRQDESIVSCNPLTKDDIKETTKSVTSKEYVGFTNHNPKMCRDEVARDLQSGIETLHRNSFDSSSNKFVFISKPVNSTERSDTNSEINSESGYDTYKSDYHVHKKDFEQCNRSKEILFAEHKSMSIDRIEQSDNLHKTSGQNIMSTHWIEQSGNVDQISEQSGMYNHEIEQSDNFHKISERNDKSEKLDFSERGAPNNDRQIKDFFSPLTTDTDNIEQRKIISESGFDTGKTENDSANFRVYEKRSNMSAVRNILPYNKEKIEFSENKLVNLEPKKEIPRIFVGDVELNLDNSTDMECSRYTCQNYHIRQKNSVALQKNKENLENISSSNGRNETVLAENDLDLVDYSMEPRRREVRLKTQSKEKGHFSVTPVSEKCLIPDTDTLTAVGDTALTETRTVSDSINEMLQKFKCVSFTETNWDQQTNPRSSLAVTSAEKSVKGFAVDASHITNTSPTSFDGGNSDDSRSSGDNVKSQTTVQPVLSYSKMNKPTRSCLSDVPNISSLQTKDPVVLRQTAFSDSVEEVVLSGMDKKSRAEIPSRSDETIHNHINSPPKEFPQGISVFKMPSDRPVCSEVISVSAELIETPSANQKAHDSVQSITFANLDLPCTCSTSENSAYSVKQSSSGTNFWALDHSSTSYDYEPNLDKVIHSKSQDSNSSEMQPKLASVSLSQPVQNNVQTTHLETDPSDDKLHASTNRSSGVSKSKTQISDSLSSNAPLSLYQLSSNDNQNSHIQSSASIDILPSKDTEVLISRTSKSTHTSFASPLSLSQPSLFNFGNVKDACRSSEDLNKLTPSQKTDDILYASKFGSTPAITSTLTNFRHQKAPIGQSSTLFRIFPTPLTFNPNLRHKSGNRHSAVKQNGAVSEESPLNKLKSSFFQTKEKTSNERNILERNSSPVATQSVSMSFSSSKMQECSLSITPTLIEKSHRKTSVSEKSVDRMSDIHAKSSTSSDKPKYFEIKITAASFKSGTPTVEFVPITQNRESTSSAEEQETKSLMYIKSSSEESFASSTDMQKSHSLRNSEVLSTPESRIFLPSLEQNSAFSTSSYISMSRDNTMRGFPVSATMLTSSILSPICSTGLSARQTNDIFQPKGLSSHDRETSRNNLEPVSTSRTFLSDEQETNALVPGSPDSAKNIIASRTPGVTFQQSSDLSCTVSSNLPNSVPNIATKDSFSHKNELSASKTCVINTLSSDYSSKYNSPSGGEEKPTDVALTWNTSIHSPLAPSPVAPYSFPTLVDRKSSSQKPFSATKISEDINYSTSSATLSSIPSVTSDISPRMKFFNPHLYNTPTSQIPLSFSSEYTSASTSALSSEGQLCSGTIGTDNLTTKASSIIETLSTNKISFTKSLITSPISSKMSDTLNTPHTQSVNNYTVKPSTDQTGATSSHFTTELSSGKEETISERETVPLDLIFKDQCDGSSNIKTISRITLTSNVSVPVSSNELCSNITSALSSATSKPCGTSVTGFVSSKGLMTALSRTSESNSVCFVTPSFSVSKLPVIVTTTTSVTQPLLSVAAVSTITPTIDLISDVSESELQLKITKPESDITEITTTCNSSTSYMQVPIKDRFFNSSADYTVYSTSIVLNDEEINVQESTEVKPQTSSRRNFLISENNPDYQVKGKSHYFLEDSPDSISVNESTVNSFRRLKSTESVRRDVNAWVDSVSSTKLTDDLKNGHNMPVTDIIDNNLDTVEQPPVPLNSTQKDKPGLYHEDDRSRKDIKHQEKSSDMDIMYEVSEDSHTENECYNETQKTLNDYQMEQSTTVVDKTVGTKFEIPIIQVTSFDKTSYPCSPMKDSDDVFPYQRAKFMEGVQRRETTASMSPQSVAISEQNLAQRKSHDTLGKSHDKLSVTGETNSNSSSHIWKRTKTKQKFIQAIWAKVNAEKIDSENDDPVEELGGADVEQRTKNFAEKLAPSVEKKKRRVRFDVDNFGDHLSEGICDEENLIQPEDENLKQTTPSQFDGCTIKLNDVDIKVVSGKFLKEKESLRKPREKESGSIREKKANISKEKSKETRLARMKTQMSINQPEVELMSHDTTCDDKHENLKSDDSIEERLHSNSTLSVEENVCHSQNELTIDNDVNVDLSHHQSDKSDQIKKSETVDENGNDLIDSCSKNDNTKKLKMVVKSRYSFLGNIPDGSDFATDDLHFLSELVLAILIMVISIIFLVFDVV